MAAENTLRDLYRDATAATDREDCLTPEMLTAVATREASGDARDRALDHIAVCSDCAQELRALRSLEPWARDVAREMPLRAENLESAPAGTIPRHRALAMKRWMARSANRGLLAAGFAAVLVVSFLIPRWPGTSEGPRPDVVRGTSDAAVQPAPDSRHHDVPELFSWTPEPGATAYRLRLLDASAQLVWESDELEETSYRLPIDVRRLLEPGRAYLWLLEIEGDVRSRTVGPFWFHVDGSGNSR